MDAARTPLPRRLRGVLAVGGLALAAGAALVALLTPWPAALLIRALFERDARKTVDEMERYTPADGAVDARTDLTYRGEGAVDGFDVFTPAGTTTPRPTVVWIHGGAWISGTKRNVAPYARILAARGYTVVTLDYGVSPEVVYPRALQQLNAALGYLVEHADELHIDPERLVIAGDSAGANLTSQLAAITTDPAYARRVGVEPTLTPAQLRGVMLNCGIYDVSGIPKEPGLGGWGFRIALWAYIGAKDWSVHPGGREMSTLDFVTAEFPATWISGGNADPLTPRQSERMAAKLRGLGVDVTTLFYPKDHEPALPHEYQFHLDFAEARNALDSMAAFLARVTAD